MIGEISALSAAFAWALATIIYAEIGGHVRSVNLNLIKGLLAGLMMTVTLGLGFLVQAESVSLASLLAIDSGKMLLLIASGMVGIGLGDSAYFGCLRRIGAQKGLMLESTAPIIAALLALFFFNEIIAISGWLGIVTTTGGVIVVIGLSRSQPLYPNQPAGIALGILAACAQAMGIVLSRVALASGEVDPLASALVRLLSGLAVLGCYLALTRFIPRAGAHRQTLSEACAAILNNGLLVKLVGAVFIGTFLALWLQQLAVRYTGAGVAQALLASCPLFGMLAGSLQGQNQRPAVWGGLALGLTGITMLLVY
jgi:drug/metabolite transporter (DMT)-like permease